MIHIIIINNVMALPSMHIRCFFGIGLLFLELKYFSMWEISMLKLRGILLDITSVGSPYHHKGLIG